MPDFLRTVVDPWRASTTWAAAGRVLAATPTAIVQTVVTLFAIIYTVALTPTGVGLVMLPLVRSAVERRAAVARSRTGMPTTEVTDGDGGNRFRGAVRWALSSRARHAIAFLLADGAVAVLGSLLVLAVFYLIGRAVLEASFIVVWPSALHGAWGGTVFGALLVHCGPGVLAAIWGTKVIRWAEGLRPRVARRLLREAGAVAPASP